MKAVSSKERVLTALAHAEPDRVPINYKANPGIHARLKAHYGVAEDDSDGLRRALRVKRTADLLLGTTGSRSRVQMVHVLIPPTGTLTGRPALLAAEARDDFR